MNERKVEVDQEQTQQPPPPLLLRQHSVPMSMSTTAKKKSATSYSSLTSRCNCRKIELKIQFASTGSSTNDSSDVVPVDNDGDGDGEDDHVFNCYCGPCRKFHTSAFVSTLRIEQRPKQQQQQENEQQKIKIVSGNEYLMKYIYHPNEEGNIDTTVAATKRRRHCPSSSSSTTVERWYCGICYTKLLSKTTPGESLLSSSSQSSSLPSPPPSFSSSSSSSSPPPPPPTKSLYWINLGPIDESTISSRLASKWKSQLYDPKHNLNADMGSRWWHIDSVTSKQNINDATKKSSSSVDISPNIWTGQCSCGSCRYEIGGNSSSSSPSMILTEQQHCHCNLCRDMSGQPFLSWMPIPQRDFRWTMMSTNHICGKKMDSDDKHNHDVEGYDSSSVIQKIQTSTFASRYLCRTCRGILMVIYHKQPDHVWLTIGSLDDTSLQQKHNTPLFGRSCHIFCKHKPSWWKIDNSNPDEPQFDEFDPNVCSSGELNFFY